MLIDYYKNIINNIGLFTDEEGFIYGGDSENKIPITTLGKPLVLPTDENIKTLFMDDPEEGIVVNKILYNPLNEDVIKKDSESLSKTKLVIETRIALMLEVVGELLLHLAENKALQTKTTLNLNKFLGSINDAKRPGIKNMIDDNVIANWSKLCKASRSNGNTSVKIYLKKGGINSDGTKFNRLATMSVTVLEHLLKHEKDEQVLGVTLRPKDVRLFTILYSFLLNVENTHTIESGNNSKESPGFLSLMDIYIKVGTRLENLLRDLKDVAVSIESLIEPVITMSIEDVNAVDGNPKIKQELLSIPNEIDVNRSVEAKRKATLLKSDMASNLNKPRPTASNPILADSSAQNTAPVATQQTEEPLKYNPEVNADPVHAILSKSPTYMTVQEKQQVQPQMNMVAQPVMGYGNPTVVNMGSGYVNPILQNNQMYNNPQVVQQQPMYNNQQVIPPNGYNPNIGYNNQVMLPQQGYNPNMNNVGYPQANMGYAQPNVGYVQPNYGYQQPQSKPMGLSSMVSRFGQL